MASNKRGRIKERLEGIHKNCEWIMEHVEKSLALIQDVNPKLSNGFKAMGKVAEQLDELSRDLFHTL